MISIVTPVYNEDGNVVYFHDEVTKVMQTLDMDYEIIYVNDGSRDGTWSVIEECARMNARIAEYSNNRPTTSARILTIEVSMPNACDSPSTKLPPAWLKVLNKPLRRSTMKRMTDPSAWPSHSKKLSTCMCAS